MSRPTKLDWVIVGWEKGGKFHVLASDQLASGDVETVTQTAFDRRDGGGYIVAEPFATSGYYEIRARTRAGRPGDGKPLVVMAQGDDYADALRNLMSFWTPERDEAPAIEPARREIET